MTKEESDALYVKLKEQYTDEEIAESFIWSVDKTPEEEKEFVEAVTKHRKEFFAKMKPVARFKYRAKIRYWGWKYRWHDRKSRLFFKIEYWYDTLVYWLKRS